MAAKKKTKSGKGWMEIVSGPGAGTYKMPEEEKEARAAAKAGRETLKAESKGKRKGGYETSSATEITKINEARKEASKKAGVWRESSYPNPISVKSSEETPAVSAPTTEKSTPVATSKPTKKKEEKPKAQPPTPTPSEAEQYEKDKVDKAKEKQSYPPAQISADDEKPKGGSKKSKNKFILNTDKSGKGKPQYGSINRARDVAAGKQQGLAARGSQQDIPDSSPAKSNKFIIGGGKSGVPASYGTMDDARKFAETERMRQDRIGNGRVRAFGDASGTPASTGGKATFYDFSDADLGISKSDAPSKPGFMDRLRGAMRGRGKSKAPESVTSPSGATSAPSAPSGGFAPPSGGSFPPPSGGRASSFDAGHTGAGHSGAVKFAPQNQFTGGGINVGNQASANQIYGGNISGGVGNISGSSMPSNPIVASTGGAARSTNKNATVLSTGGDAVQSNPRAANASSKGRPTTKKK